MFHVKNKPTVTLLKVRQTILRILQNKQKENQNKRRKELICVRLIKSLQNDTTLNNGNVLIFTFRANCCKHLILSDVNCDQMRAVECILVLLAQQHLVVVDKLSSKDFTKMISFSRFIKMGQG